MPRKRSTKNQRPKEPVKRKNRGVSAVSANSSDRIVREPKPENLEKESAEVKTDELGQPVYDHRYIMAIQCKDRPTCFKHIKEGDILKDMKPLADSAAEKSSRPAIVYDRLKSLIVYNTNSSDG